MSEHGDTRAPWAKAPSAKTIGAMALSVMLAVFIIINRDDTEISFIFFTARSSLWVALTVAAVGGFLAGFLVSRRHSR